MTDRPILFSAPMVRALLEGRKTQTRRALKPQPPETHELVGIYGPGLTAVFNPAGTRKRGVLGEDVTQRLRFAPGDRLWVKETWRAWGTFDKTPPSKLPRAAGIQYAAGDHRHMPWLARTRSSIHMPRWASRLTLLVTDVRVERLQDISEADAIAEGCSGCLGPSPDFPDEWDPTPQEEYRALWNSINGPGAWDANPWVVAVTFDVRKGNIDA